VKAPDTSAARRWPARSRFARELGAPRGPGRLGGPGRRPGARVSRFVDRGAVFAGWVGVGMAMTIAVSFLLVIPIEPVIWLMSPLAGLLIGYYANARADRCAGPWRRILLNGVYASFLTAVTLALFLAGTKAIFFYADNGYRDAGQGGPIVGCLPGADCVYRRYLAEEGKAAQFEAAGITDVASFTAFYWREQLGTTGTVTILCVVGGVFGAAMYGFARPKAQGPAAASGAPIA